jgi:predicted PurR-regulated permease PerM
MKKEVKDYFFIGILVLLIFLSYRIISPFLIILLSSFVLAYLLKPAQNWLSKFINRKFSAILCVILVLIIIMVPLTAVIGGAINQATNLVLSPEFNQFLEKLGNFGFLNKLETSLTSLLEKGSDFMVFLLSSAISYLPSLFITFILLPLTLYYFILDWDSLSRILKKYLPKKNKEKTSKEISETTKAIIYGMFFIALIQFCIAALGFYLIGIKGYFILSSLIFFFGFIPSLGPAIVWAPLSVYHFFFGELKTAILLIVLGLILSVIFDSILRAKILGKKANIHPVIMILGILGGISVFGVFGFIIGPLVLVYTLKILRAITE